MAKTKVTCLQCEVKFEKSNFEVKKQPNHFCSRSCSAKYNNRKRLKKNSKIPCSHCNKELTRKPYEMSVSKRCFCDTSCQMAFNHDEYIKRWLKGEEEGLSGTNGTSTHIKTYVLDRQSGRCNYCGLKDWQGKSITLELEHKDGDSRNNHENNLECLCPNCHSQTSTYRAKNTGNSTRVRY